MLAAVGAFAQNTDITTTTANADGSDTLWTATLTVGFVRGAFDEIGYIFNGYGSLSTRSFTIGGTTYAVNDLYYTTGQFGSLNFADHVSGFPAEQLRWALHLDGAEFLGSDDDDTGAKLEWDNPGLSWTNGQQVAVKLVRFNKATAPSNLTASAASSGRVDLSWSAPSKTGGSDVTGYRIEVSTDGGNNWTDLVADTESTDTTYAHVGLSASSTYHYRVSAINVAGTGPASNTASATTASDIATPTANADGSDTLWTATLTVGFVQGAFDEFGYIFGNYGSLSTRSFTIGGTTYAVNDLYYTTGRQFGSLTFDEHVIGFPAEQSRWALHLDGAEFLGSDDADTGATLQWDNPGLSWTNGQQVAVRLVRFNKATAPSNLTASAASSGRVDLSWSAPSKTGGSAVTGYGIEVSTDGGNDWTDLVADTESTDTTYAHVGLSAGSTYHYRVSAINVAGTGPASNTASATTASDIATPTANADGSDTLWTATLTVGFVQGAFDEFGYIFGNYGSLSTRSFTIGGTTYAVNDLYYTTGRQFGSLTFDEHVIGFPAEQSRWALHLDGAEFLGSDDADTGATLHWDNPGLSWTNGQQVAVRLVRFNKATAPSNLTASAASSGRVDLSWSAPSKTGGSAVTGYGIEVSTDGGNDWTDLVADTESTDTTYAHVGLSAGSTYHYRVSAINVAGTGPASNTASATTASDIATPTANADGSDTLWTATLTVGFVQGAFDEFGYIFGNYGSLSTRSFTIGGTTYAVNDLYYTTGRQFGSLTFDEHVIGFPAEQSRWALHLDGAEFLGSDDVDTGATLQWDNPGLSWTNGQQVAVRLVRLNVPTGPRNLHAKGDTNTEIDLSWRAPAKTGGSDITGYKIEVSTDGGDNWSDLVADTASTDTTHSHTGLTMGDTRHYRVSAINAVGTGPVSNKASATAVATPPGLARAVVERTDSLTVRLEFDEPVDTTSSPDKSAFSVNVEETPGEVTGFTIEDEGSGNGSLGWLDLASRVRPGETVTLAYTKPSSNPIKDAAGNAMDSFRDYSVTNETSTRFPEVSVGDEEAHESGDPDNPETTMTFTVSVDTEPDFAVGVYYETEDVSATGGTGCSATPIPDYVSTEGRLTLGPGESSKEVEVTVCDDSVSDSGETFRLVLFSTQLHESIEELGEIGPEGRSYEGEETASATGTILNAEPDVEVSIGADAAYVEEGTEAVFTLRRTGDAEEALTVPVTVEESGAMLAAGVPENAVFAVGARESELRVPTDDDGANEADSTVTATFEAGSDWQVAEGAASATLTVLDNDAVAVAGGTAADVTVWSADMTVVDYQNGNIGAGSADLLANQGGTAGLQAKWLYYVTGERKLKIAFDDGLDDAGSMTLHVGGLSVLFPANSGGDSSFTIPNVDVSWTDGAMLAAWVTKPSAEAVSTDATLASLTVSGATLSPAFDAGVLVYRAEVAAETETVTIAGTASDGGASIAYGPGEDADTALADFQISTPSGETLVEVTVTAADGRTARSYRVVLARVAENAAPTGLPEISGTPEVGETLTASVSAIEDADGLDGMTFAYQWLAHDGSDDTAIAGATGATHEVAADDAGKALKVRVTFTDDKGTEEVLVSAATETVVDRRPVAATLSVGAGAAEAGRFRLSIAFGDAVTGLALADLAASRVGGDAAAVSELAETETGRAWTAWVAADAGRYTVRLPAGAAASGERQSLAAVLAVDVDADGNAVAVAGPVVTSVGLAAASDGTWTEGETLGLSLTFSEPVTVATGGGTPTVGIALDGTARQASYASGSGRVAVFTYAVTADDGTVTAVSLTADSLALNGGTIRDAAGRDADLEHPGLGEATEETESAPALTGLKLVNTASGTETALADGDALVLDDPANGSWGLVASVAPEAQVGSVRLVLTGGNTGIVATADAAPYSLHGDEDGAVTGAGLPSGSYTLTATAYPEADGGGTALGTLSASFTVAASEAVAPDALTASFEGVPEVHGGPGSEAFTFRVRFSQEPRVSYAVLRDESFAVTGGGVRRARRVDGRNDLREIHVEPEGWDDVRVTLAGGRACGTEGAICTADNKVLANTAVATVPGPLALSVADAEAQEGPGVTLDFEVTLNRAASGTVTVDYATADGTATAGADYTAASGMLTFAPGETAKTVNVPVLDDAHDDTGETLTLTLSNATGARIRDGEATGTIENSDPIPQAWLARFGRTVADHVVDAAAERLTGSSGGGSQVTLGGQPIPLDGVLNGASARTSPGGSAGGDARESAAAADTLAAFADRISGDGAGGERGTAWARRGEGGGEDAATRRETRGLTERELLLGSSFLLSIGGAEANGTGTAWTAWGRAASSRFDGEADGLSLDGDVTTFTFGADAARGR